MWPQDFGVPTVVADREPVDGLDWAAQFGVAIALFVGSVAMTSIAITLIQRGERATCTLMQQQPDSLPDLGWAVAASFIKQGADISLVVGFIGPAIAMMVVPIMLLTTGQPLWPLTSLVNIMGAMYSVRSICMMVTYLPPVWTAAQARNSRLMGNDRYTIIPSGHTIATVLPLVFCALLFTDEGTVDRSMALLALFFVVLLPVGLIFGSRIHHTVDVVIAACLSVLAAYVAVDHSVSWVAPTVLLAASVAILAWNLQMWGWGKKTSMAKCK